MRGIHRCRRGTERYAKPPTHPLVLAPKPVPVGLVRAALPLATKLSKLIEQPCDWFQGAFRRSLCFRLGGQSGAEQFKIDCRVRLSMCVASRCASGMGQPSGCTVPQSVRTCPSSCVLHHPHALHVAAGKCGQIRRLLSHRYTDPREPVL
jgi:hypothetical protein